MTRSRPNPLTGPCIGGPYKGKQMAALVSPKQLALMGPVKGEAEWDETRRGEYVYDAGCWWWQGWGKPYANRVEP